MNTGRCSTTSCHPEGHHRRVLRVDTWASWMRPGDHRRRLAVGILPWGRSCHNRPGRNHHNLHGACNSKAMHIFRQSKFTTKASNVRIHFLAHHFVKKYLRVSSPDCTTRSTTRRLTQHLLDAHQQIHGVPVVVAASASWATTSSTPSNFHQAGGTAISTTGLLAS
jgi:hypothetical protein